MATMSVLKFPTPDGADAALQKLQSLQQQGLINIQDAAIVEWPNGAKKPKTRQLHSMAGVGALGGAFWGTLLGFIFFMPLVGAAIGAASGALAGAFTDVGINDDFIKQMREKVTPGTSALFLMTANEVADRVVPQLKSLNPELVTTNLSTEEETKLREIFAEAA